MPRLFKAIYADPSWNETGGGKIKRGADRHYECLKTHDIIRVMYQSGVWRPDPRGCHLWLWVTNGFASKGSIARWFWNTSWRFESPGRRLASRPARVSDLRMSDDDADRRRMRAR